MIWMAEEREHARLKEVRMTVQIGAKSSLRAVVVEGMMAMRRVGET